MKYRLQLLALGDYAFQMPTVVVTSKKNHEQLCPNGLNYLNDKGMHSLHALLIPILLPIIYFCGLVLIFYAFTIL